MKIFVDWLQYSCHLVNENLFFNNGIYNLKLLPYSTRQFKHVYEVHENNELIASITTSPSSSILPKDLCLFKFQNK